MDASNPSHACGTSIRASMLNFSFHVPVALLIFGHSIHTLAISVPEIIPLYVASSFVLHSSMPKDKSNKSGDDIGKSHFRNGHIHYFVVPSINPFSQYNFSMLMTSLSFIPFPFTVAYTKRNSNNIHCLKKTLQMIKTEWMCHATRTTTTTAKKREGTKREKNNAPKYILK